MAWKIHYGFQIRKKVGAGDDPEILASINQEFTQDMAYTRTLNMTQSFVRKFQSADTDCVGIMNGMPFGADEPDPVTPLPDVLKQQQTYATLDTPDPGLRRAIRDANRSKQAAPAGGIADDGIEDVVPRVAF